MTVFFRILTLTVIAHLCAAGTISAQELKKIRIGYPSLSFRQSNVWVAREMGLFKKYGLDVDPIFLRGGQIATMALAGGNPPIVNIGTVVQANLTGFSLVLVAAVETSYDQIVFARPGIAKLEQLKGKKFGISGFGAATHYATLILMKHLNFEPKDLTLLPTGPDAERLQRWRPVKSTPRYLPPRRRRPREKPASSSCCRSATSEWKSRATASPPRAIT